MKNNEQNMSYYVRKPEFWVGLTVVVIVVLAGGFFAARHALVAPKTAQKITPVSPSISVSVTATPSAAMMAQKEEVTVAPTAQPTPTTKPEKLTKKIAQLANTSGAYDVTVREGDSFWKIAKRICGSGKNYRSIQRYNGYTDRMTLRAGAVVSVTCE